MFKAFTSRLVCKEWKGEVHELVEYHTLRIANWDARFMGARVVHSPCPIHVYIQYKYKENLSLFSTPQHMAIDTHEYYVTTPLKDMTIRDSMAHIRNYMSDWTVTMYQVVDKEDRRLLNQYWVPPYER